MPSLIDFTAGRPQGRAIRPMAARRASMRSMGILRPANWREGRWSLLGLWGEPSTVHMAILDEAAADIAVVSLDCPDRHFPVGRQLSIRRRFAWNAPPTTCSAWRRRACPTPAPGSIIAIGACAFRSGDRIDALSKSPPYRFLPVGGRRHAPDRGRSGPCRHHRARTFPLHRKRRDRGPARTAARICPQGHRRADGRRRSRARRAARRARYRATARSPMLTRFREPSRRRSELAVPDRAPSGCARCSPNSSGLPTTSATSAPSATTLPSRLMHAHCQRAARKRAARGQCRLRPSPDAGHHRARRRDPRPRRWRAGSHPRGAGQHPPALSVPDRTLRQHRFAAGSHRRYRRAQARAGQTIRRRRLCRPRLRPVLRRAPDACLSAL